MLNAVFCALEPFLWGGALALFLNIPLSRLETALAPTRLLARLGRRARRALALGLVLAGGAAALGLGLWLLVPQLLAAAADLGGALPRVGETVRQWTGDALGDAAAGVVQRLAAPLEATGEEGAALAAQLAGAGMDAVRTAAGTLGKLAAAVVLAVYFLADKEELGRRTTLLARALLGDTRTRTLAALVTRANGIFAGFIGGQCFEACILAGLFVLALFVCGMPRVLPIAAVIGVTALVPVFGAWVGGAAGALLVFSAAPEKTLWFLVLFVGVQQFENNIIYPRVVGARIGLPPLWVFAAVLLGGALFGAAGLILGIPAMSVLYHVGGEWAASKVQGHG